MSGSQANSVALNPAGTFSGGKRFSVSGPVRGGPRPEEGEGQGRTTGPERDGAKRGGFHEDLMTCRPDGPPP